MLQESWSALLCASKEGHLEIVIELLEHQAHLEHTDMVSLCGSFVVPVTSFNPLTAVHEYSCTVQD